MDLRFVEAGNGFNWGKFAVGRFTAQEWAEPAAYPGSDSRPLIPGRGWTSRHIWVLDLQTGEGAVFLPGGVADDDLNKHQILVCPLFEPFLTWLYEHVAARPEAWWSELPRVVELPTVPGALYGYRRLGPRRRHAGPCPTCGQPGGFHDAAAHAAARATVPPEVRGDRVARLLGRRLP